MSGGPDAVRDGTLVVLKMGETFPDLRRRRGDFDGWVRAALPAEVAARVQVVEPADDRWPEPAGVARLVISGSHAMVTEASPAHRRAFRWLERTLASGVPTFGICYGHQMIGHVLGGEVGPLPGGAEIGAVDVAWTADAAADPLVGDLPSPTRAAVTHYQSIRRLPAGAVVLAASAREPHQAVRFAAGVWGVQFHPEFTGDVLAAYVERQAEVVARQGRDAAAVAAEAATWTERTGLLERFATRSGIVPPPAAVTGTAG